MNALFKYQNWLQKFLGIFYTWWACCKSMLTHLVENECASLCISNRQVRLFFSKNWQICTPVRTSTRPRNASSQAQIVYEYLPVLSNFIGKTNFIKNVYISIRISTMVVGRIKNYYEVEKKPNFFQNVYIIFIVYFNFNVILVKLYFTYIIIRLPDLFSK